jgi:hypothetical protein
MAPALVPVTPMMSIVASSSRRSSTPQVKAPCDPPPCNAKATFAPPRPGMLLGAALLAICAPRLTVLLATCAPFLSPLHPYRLRLGT